MVEVIALGKGDVVPEDSGPYVQVVRRRAAEGESATVVDVAFEMQEGTPEAGVAHDVSLTHTPLGEAVEQAKKVAERRGIERVYVRDAVAAERG